MKHKVLRGVLDDFERRLRTAKPPDPVGDAQLLRRLHDYDHGDAQAAERIEALLARPNPRGPRR